MLSDDGVSLVGSLVTAAVAFFFLNGNRFFFFGATVVGTSGCVSNGFVSGTVALELDSSLADHAALGGLDGGFFDSNMDRAPATVPETGFSLKLRLDEVLFKLLFEERRLPSGDGSLRFHWLEIWLSNNNLFCRT